MDAARLTAPASHHNRLPFFGALCFALCFSACAAGDGDSLPEQDEPAGRADAGTTVSPDSGPGPLVGTIDGGGGPDGAPEQGSGEACYSPRILTPVDGAVDVTETTVGRVRNHEAPSSCAVGAGVPEFVLQLDVPEKNWVQVGVSGAKPGVATISIQEMCPDTSLVGGCTSGSPTTGFTSKHYFEGAGTASIFVWADAHTLDLKIRLSDDEP